MLRRTDGSVRYFTLRESARIQTFPDTFLFEGTRSEVMRQLGKAVVIAQSYPERPCRRRSGRRGPSAVHWNPKSPHDASSAEGYMDEISVAPQAVLSPWYATAFP